MKYDLKTIVCIGALFTVLFVYVLNAWASLPEVYKSHSTGKCIKVVEAGVDRDCYNNFPDRYEHVWTK